MCEDIPIKLQYFKRFNKFMIQIIDSDTPYVKLCCQQVLHGNMPNVNIACHESGCTRNGVFMSPCRFNTKEFYIIIWQLIRPMPMA